MRYIVIVTAFAFVACSGYDPNAPEPSDWPPEPWSDYPMPTPEDWPEEWAVPWPPDDVEPASPRTGCGDDMIEIPDLGVCIDRYEGSAAPDGRLLSVAGAWPVRAVSFLDAEQACHNTGKRLCTADEWRAACGGPHDAPYPYGVRYEPERCHLDDTSMIHTTEFFPECEGGYPGLFDMSGNMAEWTSTCRHQECLVVGGYAGAPPESGRCGWSRLERHDLRHSAYGVRCCVSIRD